MGPPRWWRWVGLVRKGCPGEVTSELHFGVGEWKCLKEHKMDRIGISDRQTVAHACPLRKGSWEKTTEKLSLKDRVEDSSPEPFQKGAASTQKATESPGPGGPVPKLG